MHHLRLGFAGTPEFAARILEGLLEHSHRPMVVYAQPDRPVGRGRKTRPGPVRRLADEQGIAVLQPASLRGSETVAALSGYELDLLVVAAYGLLLPASVLGVPKLGCINVHASLLPRWRGAAPIERALLAGDSRTGVSIMRMERGLDTGPVYLTRACTIDARTTGPGLESDLAMLGVEALLECLAALPALEPVAQASEGVSYAAKITPADAVIDWSSEATHIDRQIRALCGRFPAFTFAGSTRVQILAATPGREPVAGSTPGAIVASSATAGIKVACGGGTLTITRLQLNRGKGLPLRAAEALNGFRELLGEGRVFSGNPA